MTRFLIILAALAALLLAPPPAPAAQPAKDQLKARFESREPELRRLKQQALVGETLDGYVSLVQPDTTPDQRLTRLVTDENNDRRSLYQILADEINREHPESKVKATIQTIGSRNALRNLEHAGPDERLLVAKDHWIRIRDFPRYQRLTPLKGQGRIGETDSGLVEIVKPEDRSDPALQSLIREENNAREAEYRALAQRERTDPSAIAKRMAKRNFDNARIGDMLKDAGGAWRKK